MGVSIALMLMGGAAFVALFVLCLAAAMAARKSAVCGEEALRLLRLLVSEALGERWARAEDVGALVGDVDGYGTHGKVTSAQRRAQVRPPSDDATPLSPIDPGVLQRLREEHPTDPPAYQGPMPALGEDEEAPTQTWERRSGTWRRDG